MIIEDTNLLYDAMKASMTGGNKTIILDKDSQIAQLFYGLNGEG